MSALKNKKQCTRQCTNWYGGLNLGRLAGRKPRVPSLHVTKSWSLTGSLKRLGSWLYGRRCHLSAPQMHLYGEWAFERISVTLQSSFPFSPCTSLTQAHFGCYLKVKPRLLIGLLAPNGSWNIVTGTIDRQLIQELLCSWMRNYSSSYEQRSWVAAMPTS